MKRLLFIVFVIGILAGCSSQMTEEPSWQEQYDLGVRYLSEGNYEQAIIAFTAAIEIDPKQAPAYVGLADAYIGIEDFEKAREIIAQAQKVCGDSEDFDQILNSMLPDRARAERIDFDDGRYNILEYDDEGVLYRETCYNANDLIVALYEHDWDVGHRETKYYFDNTVEIEYDVDWNVINYVAYNRDGVIHDYEWYKAVAEDG